MGFVTALKIYFPPAFALYAAVTAAICLVKVSFVCYFSLHLSDGTFFSVSAKTGYTDFVKVVLSFAVLWIICIIVQISAPGAAVVAWLPYIFLMVFVVLLRSHIMRRDNIPGAGSCTECLTVAFCYPCAVTQSKHSSLVLYSKSIIVFICFCSGSPFIWLPEDS